MYHYVLPGTYEANTSQCSLYDNGVIIILLDLDFTRLTKIKN